MNIDTKVTYAMHAINAYNALNTTTQEDNTNVLLKLLLYIVLRYFI
jgi:hypothetical protein